MIKTWKKYNKAQLKLFFWDSDGISKYQDFREDKIYQSDDDCIKNPINNIILNNQPPDKRPAENSQNN